MFKNEQIQEVYKKDQFHSFLNKDQFHSFLNKDKYINKETCKRDQKLNKMLEEEILNLINEIYEDISYSLCEYFFFSIIFYEKIN